jgi:hypothetical protein
MVSRTDAQACQTERVALTGQDILPMRCCAAN